MKDKEKETFGDNLDCQNYKLRYRRIAESETFKKAYRTASFDVAEIE